MECGQCNQQKISSGAISMPPASVAPNFRKLTPEEIKENKERLKEAKIELIERGKVYTRLYILSATGLIIGYLLCSYGAYKIVPQLGYLVAGSLLLVASKVKFDMYEKIRYIFKHIIENINVELSSKSQIKIPADIGDPIKSAIPQKYTGGPGLYV